MWMGSYGATDDNPAGEAALFVVKELHPFFRGPVVVHILRDLAGANCTRWGAQRTGSRTMAWVRAYDDRSIDIPQVSRRRYVLSVLQHRPQYRGIQPIPVECI